MEDFIRKITSRKFLLSLAAFLGSIGTSIAGFTAKSEMVTIIGLICATVSAAIYAAAEATVDKANGTTGVVKTVTHNSISKATQTQLSKDLVEEAKIKAGEQTNG